MHFVIKYFKFGFIFSTTFPKPQTGSGYKALGLSLVPSGTNIFYECTDSGAVLDDLSGRNFYPMVCNGTKVGVMNNSVFYPVPNNYTFPKCLSKCSSFVIGDLFQPRWGYLPNWTWFLKCRKVKTTDFNFRNSSVEVRAGQSMEFLCPPNYYVASQVTSPSINLI